MSSSEFELKIEEACEHANQGQFDIGVSILNTLLEKWHEHPRLLLLKSEFLSRSDCCKNPFDEPIHLMRKAMEMYPLAPDPAIHIARWFYSADEDLVTADTYASRAIELASIAIYQAFSVKIGVLIDESKTEIAKSSYLALSTFFNHLGIEELDSLLFDLRLRFPEVAE